MKTLNFLLLWIGFLSITYAQKFEDIKNAAFAHGRPIVNQKNINESGFLPQPEEGIKIISSQQFLMNKQAAGRTQKLMLEYRKNGFVNKKSMDAIRLLMSTRHYFLTHEKKTYLNSKDPFDSHLKQTIDQIQLAFDFHPIRFIPSTHVIGFAADDEHAMSLKEIILSYQDEPHWLERYKSGIQYVMDLRNTFFTNIYTTIQSQKLHGILESISSSSFTKSQNSSELKCNIDRVSNRLYHNEDIEKNIKFIVDRVPLNSEALDPRIVHIPPGFHNERHSHAHETVFLILTGNGEVEIDATTLSVSAGDIVFVPRWSMHQTRNTGNKELKFFAITDYGLTKRLPQNSEGIYRQNKNNVTRNGININKERAMSHDVDQ